MESPRDEVAVQLTGATVKYRVPADAKGECQLGGGATSFVISAEMDLELTDLAWTSERGATYRPLASSFTLWGSISMNGKRT